MLVFDQTRREHDAGTNPPDDSRQFDGVSGANFQMRVAIQFDKFNRCAEKRGGFFRLGRPLFRRAVRSGFAARADDKMRLAPGACFAGDDAAAAEFDVVGMRAKGQQRRKFRGVRCRLHRIGQWCHG